LIDRIRIWQHGAPKIRNQLGYIPAIEDLERQIKGENYQKDSLKNFSNSKGECAHVVKNYWETIITLITSSLYQKADRMQMRICNY